VLDRKRDNQIALNQPQAARRHDQAATNPYNVGFLVRSQGDIEGFESDLFSTNTDWIKKVTVLVVELHDWMIPNSANSHNFLAISAESRDFVVYGENIFSIRNV